MISEAKEELRPDLTRAFSSVFAEVMRVDLDLSQDTCASLFSDNVGPIVIGLNPTLCLDLCFRPLSTISEDK